MLLVTYDVMHKLSSKQGETWRFKRMQCLCNRNAFFFPCFQKLRNVTFF